MLHHQSNQFGVHLTHDAPWLLGAPLINLPLALPSAKQKLNLPPGSPNYQRFLHTQLLGRYVCYEQRPIGKGQSCCAHRLSSSFTLCTQPTPACFSDTGWHLLHQQPGWYALSHAQQHSHLQLLVCPQALSGKPSSQMQSRSFQSVHGRTSKQTCQPKDLLLAPCSQPSQVKEAQIRQVQCSFGHFTFEFDRVIQLSSGTTVMRTSTKEKWTYQGAMQKIKTHQKLEGRSH